MPHRRYNLVIVLTFVLGLAPVARAQGKATAARGLELSGFSLLGETYTGLGGSGTGWGGRNFSFTLGADLTFYHPGRYGIAIEARGVYPLYSGHVDGQRSILAGLRLERHTSWHSVTPCLDLLAGRGEIRYVNGGYLTPGILYTSSTANVGSLGGGLEVPLSPRLSFKADAQFQHWPTPVTAQKYIIAKQGSAGLVYRFGTGFPR